MSLSYLRADGHKQVVTHIWESRWFKSMYTLQRQPNQTCHAHLTLSSCKVLDHTYLTRSTHSNLSWVIDKFRRTPLLPRKKNSWLHPQHTDWLICGSPFNFSPTLNQTSSRLKLSFCRQQATRLTGHISPVCDQYVQYLLTGANPSVLNWHRRGAIIT
jgi:hypothetical protein